MIKKFSLVSIENHKLEDPIDDECIELINRRRNFMGCGKALKSSLDSEDKIIKKKKISSKR